MCFHKEFIRPMLESVGMSHITHFEHSFQSAVSNLQNWAKYFDSLEKDIAVILCIDIQW